MYGYVYLTTNLVNGKKYIGQHRSDGFDSKYYGSGVLFVKALDKYGKSNFDRIILAKCDSEEELNFDERRLIAEYDAVNSPYFYNISDGGSSGNPLAGKTAEEIQEIVSKWRVKMNSRTSEEREQTYKQWLESYNNHTPEEIEERRQRHSAAAHKARENMTDEAKRAQVDKAIETKKNWSSEERAAASANYTAANNIRWANMTPDQLERRTQAYKETRSKQTPARRAQISSNARAKTLKQYENMTEEDKLAANIKRKETWANKTEQEKADFANKCSVLHRGRIWVHNDVRETTVSPQEAEEFIKNGYLYGRKKKVKNK